MTERIPRAACHWFTPLDAADRQSLWFAPNGKQIEWAQTEPT
jgi:hypothetical protein